MGWDWHKFRKDTAFATRNLVWYTLIMSVVTEMVSAMVSALTKTGGSSESLISEVTGTAASAGMIAGVLIGVFCLFKIDGTKAEKIDIFQKSKRKMTAGAFSRFCIYMIMAQMVFSLIAAAAELILNQLGLSMDTLTELASVGSDMGIMMMIYAGFVGPVVEELVFRGFLMRRFEKYGKGFAVIVSAVLFGVMHGNPLQIVFGTLVGLILGYIAIEYSIKWSIILHIANNFILGDVIGGLFGLLPDDVEGIAFTVFLGIGFVIGFVLLIIRRKEWISWLKENAAPGSYYLNALTTPSAVIFIGYNLLNGLMLLKLIFMEPFL